MKHINNPLPEKLLLEAIDLRTQGYQYQAIEDLFIQRGYKDSYGRHYKNAVISASVVNDPRGQHLRVNRKKSRRGRPLGSKNKPKTSLPTFVVKHNPIKDQIKYLESKGFNPNQILQILKTEVRG